MPKKSVRGFTLMEVMVATGIAAISVLGVLSAYQYMTTTHVRVKLKLDTSSIIEDSQSNLRQVLLNAGLNLDQGVCSMMETPHTTGGVGSIYIRLINPNEDNLSDNWDLAFNEADWERDDNCEEHAYKRCYWYKDEVPIGQNQSTNNQDPEAEAAVGKVHIEAEFVPVESRVAEEAAFKVISYYDDTSNLAVVNARDMAFVLAVRSYFVVGGEKKGRARNLGVIWAGEVSCNKYFPDGRVLRMSPSAIGTGNYDSITETLFSDTVPDPNTGDDLLSVIWETKSTARFQIKDGVIQPDETPDSKQISMCSERRFTCKNSNPINTARVWMGTTDHRAFIMYNSTNNLVHSATLRATPQFCFESKANSAIKFCPESVDYNFSGNALDPDNPEVIYATNRRPLSFLAAEMDQGGCAMACENPSQYFNVSDNEEGLIYPVLKHQIPAVSSTHIEEDFSPNPVFCQCCYTKQCLRYGITSGPCTELPDEALDSRIPECQLSDPQIAVANFPLDAMKAEDLSGSGDKCLVMRSGGGGTIEIVAKDCNSTIPVFCYHLGKMDFARDLPASPQERQGPIIKRTYDLAAQACYSMGREVVANANVMRSAWLEAWTENRQEIFEAWGIWYSLSANNSAPSNDSELLVVSAANMYPGSGTGSTIDYINNTLAGYFVAPSPDALALWNSTSLNLTESDDINEVWTALRADTKGYLYSRIPLLPQNWSDRSLFYYKAYLLSVKEQTHGFLISNPTAAVLSHSRSRLGVLAVNANQSGGGRSVKALCRRPNGDLFLSDNRSALVSDAPNLCTSSSTPGSFLVPKTSMQWLKALQVIAPTDRAYPFPKTNLTPSAWVGLKLKSGTSDPKKDLDWNHYIDYVYQAKVSFKNGLKAEKNICVPDGFGGQSCSIQPVLPTKSLCSKFETGELVVELKNGGNACPTGQYIGQNPTYVEKFSLNMLYFQVISSLGTEVGIRVSP